MESVPEESERTPEGHDIGLLREMLALSPEERIRRNAQWVEMIEKMRAGLVRPDEVRGRLSGSR
jgi:hypothetical protein